MVNGSTGFAAELRQGHPFQQDLFQEDQPKELKEEDPSAVFNPQREQSDQKEKEEEEEEKEEESPKYDPLDDLYTSLSSSDVYNNRSAFAKPLENTVRVINTLALVISPFL